jgi:predicted  nucleic acid-binding Zn-ribbon protein
VGESQQQPTVTGLHAELRRELDVLRDLVERQSSRAADLETERDRLAAEHEQLVSEVTRLRKELSAGAASNEAAAGEARALVAEARSLRAILADSE